MQKKLNEDFIDGYCEKFASIVTTNFFKDGKEVISGKEILKITPSKQVNFFVIKLLFRYWQEETKKLESPFFNYKHEDVRQAMIQFMNVLSQHIEINKFKFKTLLNHAVKDTIYLASMPQAYVEIDLDSRGVELIREKNIEGTVKYLTIYKKEISNFLSDMKGLTIDDVIDELPDEFDEFDTTEGVEEQCALLSEILEITPDKIYSEDPDMDMDEFDDFDEDDLFEPGEEDLVEERKSIAPDASEEDDEIEVSSDDEAMEDEDFSEDLDESEKEKPVGEEKKGKEQEESSVEATATETSEETKEESFDEEDSFDDEGMTVQDEKEDDQEEREENGEENQEEEPSRAPVLLEEEDREDDFPAETIHSQFEQDEEETVAEHHESSFKGDSILSLISLNHRYMFIKELFQNDKREFESALSELEDYNSFDESVEFLVQGYAKTYEWNMQSDEVKEFLKVLFRRFR